MKQSSRIVSQDLFRSLIAILPHPRLRHDGMADATEGVVAAIAAAGGDDEVVFAAKWRHHVAICILAIDDDAIVWYNDAVLRANYASFRL